MELWIRSQSKNQLVKVENIYIHEDMDKTIHIWADGSKNLTYYLGMYATKERALEVLDEIQNLIKPKTILTKMGEFLGETCEGIVYRTPDEYDIKELSTIVYEMPKE